MPSIEVIDERSCCVAVAVMAIMCIPFGIRLRTYPILNKHSRKVSPLHMFTFIYAVINDGYSWI